jgi:hypothetical protein
MEGRQFAKLVANLRRDGVLTSLPLVHRDQSSNSQLTILSGNHRVAAAIKAGIEESDVIEVTNRLTREQFVALQLSHNAIVGQDDQAVLKELYEELDFEWKEYSGLTDEAFNVAELDVTMLRVDQPFFEELTIAFLPGDKAIFMEWLDKLARSKAAARLVGQYEDFTQFFDAIIAVKEAKGVVNSAVALRLMAELAGRQLEAEQAEQEAA